MQRFSLRHGFGPVLLFALLYPLPESERPRTMKRALLAFAVFAALVLYASAANAQEFPRAELFAGYSYVNLDTNGLTSRQSMNGWESGAVFSFNRWVAAESASAAITKTTCSAPA